MDIEHSNGKNVLYRSAMPVGYWFIFGWYEPMLTFIGCIGAILYPKQAHDNQAPWPQGIVPESQLALATLVTLVQLAHTVALLGLINFCILRVARRYLHEQPALQEKVVSALLTPLLLGDIFHMSVTMWALGDERWQPQKWRNSGTLWLTMVTGISLLLPRIAWHLGMWRYVHARDGKIVYRTKRT